MFIAYISYKFILIINQSNVVSVKIVNNKNENSLLKINQVDKYIN
jgi:hypothetical protein